MKKTKTPRLRRAICIPALCCMLISCRFGMLFATESATGDTNVHALHLGTDTELHEPNLERPEKSFLFSPSVLVASQLESMGIVATSPNSLVNSARDLLNLSGSRLETIRNGAYKRPLYFQLLTDKNANVLQVACIFGRDNKHVGLPLWYHQDGNITVPRRGNFFLDTKVVVSPEYCAQVRDMIRDTERTPEKKAVIDQIIAIDSHGIRYIEFWQVTPSNAGGTYKKTMIATGAPSAAWLHTAVDAAKMAAQKHLLDREGTDFMQKWCWQVFLDENTNALFSVYSAIHVPIMQINIGGPKVVRHNSSEIWSDSEAYLTIMQERFGDELLVDIRQ